MTAAPAPVTLLQVGSFAPEVQAALDAAYRCVHPDDVARDPACRAAVRALVTRSNLTLPPELVHGLPHLELIATFGVGYDGIPLDVARARGIVVANTPGVLNAAVAELCVGLLLALLRRLPQADAFVRAGRWRDGAFPLGASLAGRRVGIVGLGGIGKEVAARLAPFGVDLGYHGRTDQQLAWRYEPDLADLAAWADVLVVTAPGGAETARMVDARVLQALGPQGVLVNVARGSLVDEAALLAALEKRTIAGAALDVFDAEPAIDPRFFALDNVVLAPHLGSATVETRAAMGRLFLENVRMWFSEGRVVAAV